jgi:hypothetical protein
MGYGLQVMGYGLRVRGYRLRVKGLGFRVKGLWFKDSAHPSSASSSRGLPARSATEAMMLWLTTPAGPGDKASTAR